MGSMALPNLNVQSDGSRVDRHGVSTAGVAGTYSGGLSYNDMLSSFMNDGGEKQSDNKGRNNKSAAGSSSNQQTSGNNDSMSMLNALSFKSLPIMNYTLGGQTATKVSDESQSNQQWDDQEGNMLMGDLDGNGVVDETDTQLAVKCHFGETKGIKWQAADFDGNGEITAADLADVMNTKNKDLAPQYKKEVRMGDINEDGKIDESDLDLLRKYVLGDEKNIRWKLGDFNEDGKITAQDLSDMRNLVNEEKAKSTKEASNEEKRKPIKGETETEKQEYVEEKQTVTQSGILGDLNNDWDVDEKDRDVLREYNKSNIRTIYNADVDGNGVINSNDLDKLQIVFGNDASFSETVEDSEFDSDDINEEYAREIKYKGSYSYYAVENELVKCSNGLVSVSQGTAIERDSTGNARYIYVDKDGFDITGPAFQDEENYSIDLYQFSKDPDVYYDPDINENMAFVKHNWTGSPSGSRFGTISGEVRVYSTSDGNTIFSGEGAKNPVKITNYMNHSTVIGGTSSEISVIADNVKIIGGRGENKIDIGNNLTHHDNITILGNNYGDVINVVRTSNLQIYCGNGNDRIRLFSTPNAIVDLGDGDNEIEIGRQGYAGEIRIVGSGNGSGSNKYIFSNSPYFSYEARNPVTIENFDSNEDEIKLDVFSSNVEAYLDKDTNSLMIRDKYGGYKNEMIAVLPNINGGTARISFKDGKVSTLDELLGKDTNSNSLEKTSEHVITVPGVQSEERTHMATTPDGWVEYAKNATVTLDQWNMVHVNEEGNIDRIALTSLDRKAIIDRASTPIGITNQSGEILGSVQGSAEVVRKTNDNPSMKEQFNIFATGYNIKASVFAEKSVIEAQNTVGENRINAYGDYSVVMGGKGDDHINIYGKHVYAYGNEGRDTFYIGSANVSRKDASGKSLTTSYKAEAATIKGFNGNEDNIIFGNSIGKLKVKGVEGKDGKAVEIHDSSGKLIATVFTDNVDSIKKIVDDHNVSIEIQEVLNGFEEKKSLIRDKITEAITDVFVPKQDIYAGIEKLTDSIIVTEKREDADISKNVLIEFLKPIMDKISSSGTSAEIFKNPSSFYTWISNNVTNLKPITVENYTIRYDSSLVSSGNAAVNATVMQGNKKIAELAFTNVDSKEAREGIEEFGKAMANLNTEAWINFVKEFYKDAFGISLDNPAEIAIAKGRTDIAANVATAVVESFYNEDNKIVSSIFKGVNEDLQLLFIDSDKMNSLKQLITDNLGSSAKTVTDLLDCLIEFAPSLKSATTMTQAALKADSNNPLDVLENYKSFSNKVDKLLK